MLAAKSDTHGVCEMWNRMGASKVHHDIMQPEWSKSGARFQVLGSLIAHVNYNTGPFQPSENRPKNQPKIAKTRLKCLVK
jgi:hypothetical protein